MNKHPTGKGYLIWSLAHTALGDPQRAAEMARAARLNWVAIKIHDGTAWYNGSAPAVRAWVDAFLGAGVSVWAWGYNYASDPRAEAFIAIERMHLIGPFAGYIINAEHQYKAQPDAARRWVLAFREREPEMALGLCSYRYPSLHGTFPWREFLERCDFHMPQVYWMGDGRAVAPAQQLARSLAELRAIRDLPVVPLGVSSPDDRDTWRPTLEQIRNFDQAAHGESLPGVGWWSWQHAERVDPRWWAEIASHVWPRADQVRPMPLFAPDTSHGSKIGLHVIVPNRTRAIVEGLAARGARLAGVLAVEQAGVLMEVKRASPQTPTFWRLYTPWWDGCDGIGAWAESFLAQRAADIAAYARRRWDELNDDERAGIDLIVLLNEADPPTLAGWRQYGELCRLIVEQCAALGLRVALPAWNYGTPEWDELRAFVQAGATDALAAHGGALVIHEGVNPHSDDPLLIGTAPIPGAPAVPGAGDTAGRYRYLLHHLRSTARRAPPIIVGEFYSGGDFDDLAGLLARFARYDGWAREDPAVVCVCGFSTDPGGGWDAQDYTPLMASQAMQDYLAGETGKLNATGDETMDEATRAAIRGALGQIEAAQDVIETQQGVIEVAAGEIAALVEAAPAPAWWETERLPFVAVARALPLTTYKAPAGDIFDVRPGATYDLNVTERAAAGGEGWLKVAPLPLWVKAADVKLKGS